MPNHMHNRVRRRNADWDVAVIGAGAAGIAAGLQLREAGLRVRIFEAGNRIGGRAWTESKSLGVPFDRGCAWFHCADRNPLRLLADTHGVHYSGNPTLAYHVDDHLLSEDEARDLRAAVGADVEAIRRAGLAGVDRSAREYLMAGAYHAAVRDYLISAINGVAPEAYATAEAAADDDTGQDWIVREGIGHLLQQLARPLSITTGCAVTAVDATGPGVQLTTGRGRLRAACVLITVSTGVLATGAIRFRPSVPEWKASAIAAVPMGVAEKVGIRFQGDPFPVPPDTYLVVQPGPDTPAFGLHLCPAGHPIAVGYAGGPLAHWLADATMGEVEAFALDHLAAAFGNAIRTRAVRATRTNWRHDPLTLGSYSAARPNGGHAQRHALAQPLWDRVYYAGEATHVCDFATAHGAWLSGQRAASQVIEGLTNATAAR